MIKKNLYTLFSSSHNKITIKLADENHPIFKSHFPANPILPAFIHLEIIADIFQIEIKAVKKAKFTRLVKPNQIIIYNRKKSSFLITCDGKTVAHVQIN